MPPINRTSQRAAVIKRLVAHFPKLLELGRTTRKLRAFRYRYHRRPDALSAAVGAYTKAEPAADERLIERLASSYLRRTSETPSDQWLEIFSDKHGDIHEAIVGGHRLKLAEILRNPVSSDLLYGFDSLAKSLRKQGRRIEDRYAPEWTLDTLACLAEAIGARRLEYPENYVWGATPLRTDEVISQIEGALGFTLPVPNPYPGEYGLLSHRGIISYRVPQALYQAWRIAQLTRSAVAPKVLEIGGGLGRTAYYARQFGITNYTIIDIPVSSLAQGYFLGRVLGEDAVQLYGESPDTSGTRVKVLSTNDFLTGSERYDLIMNVDSLTEIGRDAANLYWPAIRRQTKHLLSINHEMNDFTMADLIKQSNRIAQYSRSPYWMRRGYVEELVDFD